MVLLYIWHQRLIFWHEIGSLAGRGQGQGQGQVQGRGRGRAQGTKSNDTVRASVAYVWMFRTIHLLFLQCVHACVLQNLTETQAQYSSHSLRVRYDLWSCKRSKWSKLINEQVKRVMYFFSSELILTPLLLLMDLIYLCMSIYKLKIYS